MKRIRPTVTIMEFRRQCLSWLAHLPAEGIIITRGGQPLAHISPLQQPRGNRVVLPLLKGKGQPGPLCPNLVAPDELLFD
jgi:antitoxin (DNA-binding transcriptional repressor) of toxin-antitoxin stability system